MNVNTQFAVCIHALVYLVRNSNSVQSSSTLASSIGTNSVVVRRLMKSLEYSGLIEVTAGKNGGFCLRKPPDKMTMWEIFESINTEPMFSIHRTAHPKCPIGSKIENILKKNFRKVNAAICESMSAITLEDLSTF